MHKNSDAPMLHSPWITTLVCRSIFRQSLRPQHPKHRPGTGTALGALDHNGRVFPEWSLERVVCVPLSRCCMAADLCTISTHAQLFGETFSSVLQDSLLKHSKDNALVSRRRPYFALNFHFQEVSLCLW